MKGFRHRSFSLKLWAAMIMLILVVLVGLGGAITVLFGDFYLQQKLAELGNDAKTIANQLNEIPNGQDRLLALERLRLASGTQLTIVDNKGEILAVVGELVFPNFGIGSGLPGRMSGKMGDMSGMLRGNMPGLVPSAYPSDLLDKKNLEEVFAGKTITIEAGMKNKVGLTMLIAAAPLGKPVEAAMVLGTSPAPVQASIGAFKRIIVYSSLVAVGLATLVSLFFARQVTRPLDLMQKGARRMAQGNFQPIKGITSKDELGELATALNSMGESLSNHVNWLSEERNLLRGVVEGISDAVIMLDQSGDILYANDPAKALWQAGNRDSKNGNENPERKARVLSALKEVIHNEGDELNFQLPLDTQVLQVGLASAKLNPGQQGLVVVLRDVTASLRGEKERREFMASVTHELRTPLHLIQGYLEAMHDGVIPKEEQSEHIEMVLDEARRLARLVAELQDVNQLEHWRLVEKSPVDIGSFLQELRYRFQGRADEEGVRLDIQESRGEVVADRDRLLQVFINLLDNAFRHTPAGKTISIRVETSESSLSFVVEDQGEGIHPSALPYIFEPFYRVDKARSRRDGGMGLGLAITKQIVEAHGGDVGVESEIGVGTRFYITLPVYHSQENRRNEG